MNDNFESGITKSNEPPSLHVLIVDDEPLARAKIRSVLSQCTQSGIGKVYEASDAEHALITAQGCPINVALLDVQMPGMNGVMLARKLRETFIHMAFIFVTAYEEHALNAFEVEAVDYLTKPVRTERLAAALERASRWLQSREITHASTTAPHVMVRERGALLRVPLATILYFKAEMKYTTLRTNDREFVIETPLSELEEQYAEHFVRVHRNALVSVSAIQAVSKGSNLQVQDDEGSEGWVVQLRGLAEPLAVSRRQLPEVKTRFQALS
jgi:two-component system, LytTR family, response regulator AlgR